MLYEVITRGSNGSEGLLKRAAAGLLIFYSNESASMLMTLPLNDRGLRLKGYSYNFV